MSVRALPPVSWPKVSLKALKQSMAKSNFRHRIASASRWRNAGIRPHSGDWEGAPKHRVRRCWPMPESNRGRSEPQNRSRSAPNRLRKTTAKKPPPQRWQKQKARIVKTSRPPMHFPTPSSAAKTHDPENHAHDIQQKAGEQQADGDGDV